MNKNENHIRKKHLRTDERLSRIQIFEDTNSVRVQFIPMVKKDQPIREAETREGTTFYEWKEDGYAQKTTGLYDGGAALNYSMDNVKRC